MFAGKTAALHTLGRKVNEYETDYMRAALEDAGFSIVEFHQRADVYVINT
jgi:threonylcarbamoyladenosine tRNA methylthiotransferase MtaB